jgi:hypothetical protein
MREEGLVGKCLSPSGCVCVCVCVCRLLMDDGCVMVTDRYECDDGESWWREDRRGKAKSLGAQLIFPCLNKLQKMPCLYGSVASVLVCVCVYYM